MPFADLKGKVAVVTGGSRGAGAAACRLLSLNGARVAAVAGDELALQEILDELRWMGAEAIGVVAQCTQPRAVAAVHDCVVAELGIPQLLLAFDGPAETNAGSTGNGGSAGSSAGSSSDSDSGAGSSSDSDSGAGSSSDSDSGAGSSSPPLPPAALAAVELSLREWRGIVDSGLNATFVTVQAFLPSMLAAGEGSIVTLAATGPSSAARAAGAGVAAFTRQVAEESGAGGVRANCVAWAPGHTDARGVAHAALYLASGAASGVNATTLDVAGGNVRL